MIVEIISHIDTKTYIMILSVCVSLSIAMLIFYQSFMMRKHNRISVKPHIISWIDEDREKDKGCDYHLFHLKIKNNGIGPAIIKDYSVLYEGKEVRATAENFQETTEKPDDKKTIFHKEVLPINKDFYLPAGDQINLMKIKFSTGIDRKLFREFLTEFTVNLLYESIYETKLTYNSKNFKCYSSKQI